MASPPDSANGRVTLAVVQNEIKHVRADLERYHKELCSQVRESDERHMDMLRDHEERLRNLEGSQGWNVWRDVGAFMAAIGAGVAGLVKQ